ncbi:MAG: GntR family transcriptional regulator [Bacteroidota bacterium]
MIQHTDLSKPVYEALKQMIETGQLKPGEKLKQESLAAKLGVSRTPLLKALQMLEHELIVESKPRRGMYVKEVSLQEMVEVYECREALESMAVRLIIQRAEDHELKNLSDIFAVFTPGSIDKKAYEEADERFHNMIISLAKNPVLTRMSALGNIHKRVYLYGLLRPPEETLQEHLNIAAALSKRDVELADKEIRNHLVKSRQTLIEQIHE